VDVSLYSLFGVVIVLGVNQLLLRWSVFRDSLRGFLAVQTINITMSILILSVGLPGYGSQPAISWVVGLSFLAHTGQNGRMQSKWQRRRRQQEASTRAALAEDIRGSLGGTSKE
jgi:hypothetical protein